MKGRCEVNEKLSECPFCGEQPSPSRGWVPNDGKPTGEVVCHTHGCPLYNRCVPIATWNTRTDSTQLKAVEQERDRLRKALALANSMILSGESHSATSKAEIEQALTPDKEK